MKNYLLFILLVMPIAFEALGAQYDLTDKQKIVPNNQWGPLTYNTQISIGLDDKTSVFKTNQVINLLVRVKNLSTNQQFGFIIGTPISYTVAATFIVTSPSGKDISPVMYNSNRIHGLPIWVHPGQIDGFSFQLGEICQYHEIGTYKILIKMQRPSPDRRKLYDIVSNPLSVTIIPD
jgi:hypothetical protein